MHDTDRYSCAVRACAAPAAASQLCDRQAGWVEFEEPWTAERTSACASRLRVPAVSMSFPVPTAGREHMGCRGEGDNLLSTRPGVATVMPPAGTACVMQ